MATTRAQYTLCDGCKVGVANDDWSHISAAHDDVADEEEAMASIEGTLELLGYLAFEEDADQPGYFDCAVCGETQCGGGALFSGEVTR